MSSYISLYNETNADFNNLTVTGDIDLSEADIIVGSIKFQDGTALAPSITFASDTDTGLFRQGTNSISITTGGTERLRIGDTEINAYETFKGTDLSMTGQILGKDGSNISVSFGLASDPSTGFYRSGAATIGVSSNGIQVARFNLSNMQTFVPLLLNGNTMSCGGILSSGIISCGTNSLTCGALFSSSISSSGTFTNGTNAMTTGDLSCTSLTSTGFITNGTNPLTTGSLSCISLTSTGTISNGTNPLTAGSISCTSLTSTGQILGEDGLNTSVSFGLASDPMTGFYRSAAGTLAFSSHGSTVARFGGSNVQIFVPLSLTGNALTCGAILASGTISCGTNAMTCGSLTSTTATITNLSILSPASGSALYLDAVNNVTGSALTSGQLLIGRTGNTPVAGNITGTTNQINVTNGSGTIGLATPQDIATTSDVVFNSASLTDHLYIKNSVTATIGTAPLQIAGFASNLTTTPNILLYNYNDIYPLIYIVPYSHDDIDINLDCYRVPGSSWNSSSATSNYRINKGIDLNTLYAAGISQAASITWKTGTSLSKNGQFAIGSSAITTDSHKLQIYGTDNSSSLTDNANIATYTTADTYPLLQIQSQQHNNIVLGFDTYWDGSTYRSSNASSNFQLGKVTNQLKVLYGSGTAQGSVPALSVASFWDTSGGLTCNQNLNVGGNFNSTGQPYLQYTSSTYISLSNSTITVYSLWDTKISVQGGMTTNGTTITVPTAGKYMVLLKMNMDASSVGGRAVFFTQNAGTDRFAEIIYPASSIEWRATTSDTITMAANDTIQVSVFQNSGASLHTGTVTAPAYARITMYKIF